MEKEGLGTEWNWVFFSYSFPTYFVSETHEATLLHQLEKLASSHWISMYNHKHLLPYTNLSNKTTSGFSDSSWILWKCSHSPDLKWSLQRQMYEYTHLCWPVSKHHNHSQAETFLFYCPANEWTQIFICSPSTVLRGQQVVKTKTSIVIRCMKVVFRTCGSTFGFLLS